MITPKKFPFVCGNSVDVNRISNGLIDEGVEVDVVTPDDIDISDKGISGIDGVDVEFDLVHMFHSYKSRIGVEVASQLGVPYVVTMTGTDFNVDLFGERKDIVLDVINNASYLTFISNAAELKVTDQITKVSKKLIKRGKLIIGGKDKVDYFREKFGFCEDDFVFLVNAVIRPIKNIISVIEPLEKLYNMFPNVKLLFVGEAHPEEKTNYFDKFQKAIADKVWIKYVGGVSFEDIGGIYSLANVIINSSLSEASPVVIEEALTMGKPVLVSNIEGNKAIVENKVNGLVYDCDEDLYELAKLLYVDENLREKLSVGAFSRECNKNEIEDYIEIYKHVISSKN
ncbi:MAG: glycosyltransferase family 4 protein [Candidatus Scalindua sp.]|nr:glycosyltransferase family 4 protein [Candidatus Scalindua sp.]